MNGLAGLLGEDALDASLATLMRPERRVSPADWRAAVRAAASPEAQPLVDDWTRRVVLYDLGVERATAAPRPDGWFDVTLRLRASRTERRPSAPVRRDARPRPLRRRPRRGRGARRRPRGPRPGRTCHRTARGRPTPGVRRRRPARAPRGRGPRRAGCRCRSGEGWRRPPPRSLCSCPGRASVSSRARGRPYELERPTV